MEHLYKYTIYLKSQKNAAVATSTYKITKDL